MQFGRLVDIISQISQHLFWREIDKEEMGILLKNRRSIREVNNIKVIVLVFREVFLKLSKYYSDHQDFIKLMK